MREAPLWAVGFAPAQRPARSEPSSAGRAAVPVPGVGLASRCCSCQENPDRLQINGLLRHSKC